MNFFSQIASSTAANSTGISNSMAKRSVYATTTSPTMPKNAAPSKNNSKSIMIYALSASQSFPQVTQTQVITSCRQRKSDAANPTNAPMAKRWITGMNAAVTTVAPANAFRKSRMGSTVWLNKCPAICRGFSGDCLS